MSQLIHLNQPLPCSSSELGPGLVYELSPSALHIKFQHPQARAKSHETALITVKTLEGQSFTINTKISAPTLNSTEFHTASVHQDSERSKLKEVLGLVRKNQHIDICQTQDVEASDRFTGFSDVSFMPVALPEMSYASINSTCTFLGREFGAPILITGMTGGVEKGAMINQRLARAAARYNIPMGVGSQRVALENSQYAAIFQIKNVAPEVFLIGNLGFAQLREEDYLDSCKRAVEMIGADALAIHLNVLQELVQVEGDRDFSGVLERIAKVCETLSVPVIVKEVGSGVDTHTATRLIEAGVSAIDVGGKGGTSWSYIEGLRSSSELTQQVAATFRNWGIPTAFALSALKKQFPAFSFIATGGVRDGLTVAKAVALGANMVGVGLPLFNAALESEERLATVLETYIQGLKTTMLATSSEKLSSLRSKLVFSPHPLEQEFKTQ
jgi:isopentenyl-diphosphate delta-isomerase